MASTEPTGTRVETGTRLKDPDAFYARLIHLHEGLTPDQSNRLNASIILTMANQIGDDALLWEILDLAVDATRS